MAASTIIEIDVRGANGAFPLQLINTTGLGQGPFKLLASTDAPVYAASGTSPVSGDVDAPATTGWLTPLAGRLPYLWLSGGTSASGYFEYSNNAGSTAFAMMVEGEQLGTFSYAAASFNQVMPVPLPDQAAVYVRVNFTAVSGTVSYTLSQ